MTCPQWNDSVKLIAPIVLTFVCVGALAKLPPPSAVEVEVMRRNLARQTWIAKQDAFESCRAQDNTVKKYQEGLRAQGKSVPPGLDTGACSDPGPYAADSGTPIVNRPIEASGAHSPPGTAVTAPSSKIPQSEMQPKK
jgi:hypothetical protein